MLTNTKETKIHSPGKGRLLPLSDVPDPVFSGKMMGNGAALEPTSGTITAPMNGEIVLISPTKHAFGMKNDKGIELLVHVGIDTVKLEGHGFKVLQETGSFVKQGTPIIEADLEYIRSKGIPTITPVILLNQIELTFEDVFNTEVSENMVIFKVL